MYTLTSEDINLLRKRVIPVQGEEKFVTMVEPGVYLITGGAVIKSLELDSTVAGNVHITFEDVTFLGKVVMDRMNNDRYTFKDCIFNGLVTLDHFGNKTFLQGQAYFKNHTTLKLFSGDINPILIQNVEFETDLKIVSSQSQKLEIKNINKGICKGRGRIILRKDFNDVQMSDVSINYLLLGSSKENSNTLNIKNELDIINLHAHTVKMNAATLGNVWRIKACKIQDLQISNFNEGSNSLEISEGCKIINCSIHLGTVKCIKISGKSKFTKLSLQGDLKDEQSITIDDCTIENRFNINGLENKGKIIFKQLLINEQGILSLTNSDLGKAKFIKCFIETSRWEFENSQINEIFTVNTDFPLRLFRDGNRGPDHPQERLAFGQLHTACKKQGDTVGELNYQSQELEAYYGVLKHTFKNFIQRVCNRLSKARRNPSLEPLTIKKHWPILKHNLKMPFKIFNLWLNKSSNNFGRSWFRGVIFTVLCAVGGFYLVVILSDEYTLGTNFYLNRFASPFFKFINPIRFFDLDSLFEINSKNHLTFGFRAYFIDFLTRIMLTYGYYQTIQAFRRLGKT